MRSISSASVVGAGIGLPFAGAEDTVGASAPQPKAVATIRSRDRSTCRDRSRLGPNDRTHLNSRSRIGLGQFRGADGVAFPVDGGKAVGGRGDALTTSSD